MALDTTIGGVSADSYVTLAEWHTYAADYIDEDITAHGHDTSHEANLRRAAAYLDRTYNWVGYRANEAQSMQWPRDYDDYVEGFLISETAIPTAIKNAQMELAWLIHEGVDVFATVENGAIISKSVKAGSVETSTEYQGTREQASFIAIEGLIAPYSTGRKSGGGMNAVSLLRG